MTSDELFANEDFQASGPGACDRVRAAVKASGLVDDDWDRGFGYMLNTGWRASDAFRFLARKAINAKERG